MNRDGSTGGSSADNFLTADQEEELNTLVKNMNMKNKEYGGHIKTIKQSWVSWGKGKSRMGERATEIFERARNASSFERVGRHTSYS
jgi:hypothetical protein